MLLDRATVQLSQDNAPHDQLRDVKLCTGRV